MQFTRTLCPLNGTLTEVTQSPNGLASRSEKSVRVEDPLPAIGGTGPPLHRWKPACGHLTSPPLHTRIPVPVPPSVTCKPSV